MARTARNADAAKVGELIDLDVSSPDWHVGNIGQAQQRAQSRRHQDCPADGHPHRAMAERKLPTLSFHTGSNVACRLDIINPPLGEALAMLRRTR